MCDNFWKMDWNSSFPTDAFGRSSCKFSFCRLHVVDECFLRNVNSWQLFNGIKNFTVRSSLILRWLVWAKQPVLLWQKFSEMCYLFISVRPCEIHSNFVLYRFVSFRWFWPKAEGFIFMISFSKLMVGLLSELKVKWKYFYALNSTFGCEFWIQSVVAHRRYHRFQWPTSVSFLSDFVLTFSFVSIHLFGLYMKHFIIYLCERKSTMLYIR